MGMSAKNRRALLNLHAATWSLQDLVRFARLRDADASYVDPSLKRATAFPADPTILCWWCRKQHPAREVEKCMALPTKRAAPPANGSSSSAARIGELFKPYPELWAFLTATSLPDGTKRPTGKFSLSCGPSGLTIALTDEYTGTYVSLVGETIDDLFLMVEAGLAANELPWRASKFIQGKRR
jgi:hypothetical protein